MWHPLHTAPALFWQRAVVPYFLKALHFDAVCEAVDGTGQLSEA